MKKNIKLFSYFLLSAALLFSACSDDDDDVPPPPPPPEPEEVALEGTIAKIKLQSVQRTELTDEVTIVWGENDKLNLVYTPEGEEEEFISQLSIAQGFANKTTADFTVKTPIEWVEGAVKHDFFAYYPSTLVRSGNSVTATISATQNQTGNNDFIGSGDLLVAKTSSDEVLEKVKMDFNYPLTVLKIVVDAENTDLSKGQFESLLMTSENPLVGKVMYDAESDKFTVVDGEDEIELPFEAMADFSETVTIWLNVVPPAKEESLTFFFESDDYEGHFIVRLSDTENSQGGTQYTYNVNISELLEAGDAEIFNKNAPEIGDHSNSYIVAPGAEVFIPVERIYELWASEFGENLSGTATVELVWVDTPGGLAANSAVEAISLIAGDEGKDDIIKVKTGNEEGNALIAYKVDGEIRWSWHIWVTSYDPDNGGQTYLHMNYDVNYETGYVEFMDRNLGAVSIAPDDPATFGFLYQWGRKDPFPGLRDVGRSNNFTYNSRAIYDAEGVLLTDIDGDSDTGIRHSVDIAANNIPASILNPTVYYGSYTNMHWSTNSADLDVRLWTRDYTEKSVYDPCPEGWRVPFGVARPDIDVYISPWGRIEKWEKQDSYGVYFDEVGFYPFTGRRSSLNGEFEAGGMMTNMWTSDYVDYGFMIALYAVTFNPSANLKINTSPIMYSSEANPIRCAKVSKEEK